MGHGGYLYLNKLHHRLDGDAKPTTTQAGPTNALMTFINNQQIRDLTGLIKLLLFYFVIFRKFIVRHWSSPTVSHYALPLTHRPFPPSLTASPVVYPFHKVVISCIKCALKYIDHAHFSLSSHRWLVIPISGISRDLPVEILQFHMSFAHLVLWLFFPACIPCCELWWIMLSLVTTGSTIRSATRRGYHRRGFHCSRERICRSRTRLPLTHGRGHFELNSLVGDHLRCAPPYFPMER